MAELHPPYNYLCWCIIVSLGYIKLQSLNSLDVNPSVQESQFISHSAIIMNGGLAIGVGTLIFFGPISWFYWRLMKAGRAKDRTDRK
jgi:hypothetical protein